MSGSIQASSDKQEGVNKSENKAEEIIELKKAIATDTPNKRREDDVKTLKSCESSPSVLRPIPAKNGRRKSSENSMVTPPLSTSPTPNDIKSGSASLMTYFTADRASPSTVPQSNRAKTLTQIQEQPPIAKKEKEYTSQSRSPVGGQIDPTPGHYYEHPNAKMSADKTMEKSIALMISKAAENESHSEHEYEALSPKSNASASVKENTDSNSATVSTPKKSDITHLHVNGSGDVGNNNLKKDKIMVMQSAGDINLGPNDVTPAVTFLPPDNNMASLSTRYNIIYTYCFPILSVLSPPFFLVLYCTLLLMFSAFSY